ncbi:hypothetical protein D3C84_994550 [compost metagenome]
MLGRQRNTRGALQLAVLNQRGDPPVQRAGMPFTSDRGDQPQFMGVLRQILTLGQPSDQLLISQFPGFANAVDQDDPLESLPDFEILKYRQERRDARACG